MSQVSVVAHRRRLGAALVAGLLCSTVGIVASAAPAGAVSLFVIDLVPLEPVIAGASADVALRVTNNGADVSQDGSVDFTFPAGVTPVAAFGACGGLPALSCSLGPFGQLLVGETAEIRVRVEIDADFVVDHGGGAGSAEGAIQVQINYTGGAQSGQQELIVGERSDLRVRKYASQPVAYPGDIVTYQIDVDNLGPSTARVVTMQDTLMGAVSEADGKVTVQSCAFSVSQGGGAITQFTCATGPVVTSQFGSELGTFSTSLLEPMRLIDNPDPGLADTVGGRMRASFRLTANDTVWLDNEVRVMSETPDPDTSNNMANTALSFQAAADLSVTKTVAAPTAEAGDLVSYTITATNNGQSDATNVVVKDLLPANLQYVSATTPGGVCLSGTPGDIDDPVVCYLGGIVKPISAVAQSEVITLTARVKGDQSPGTMIANRAMVSSSTPDLNNANDAAEAVVEVVAAPVVPPVVPPADPDLFNPLTPTRQFDTRNGTGGVPIGKVAAGMPLAIQVAGVNGVPLTATAVSLNVTVVAPEGDGWMSVYPCASPPVASSNLNFVSQQTVPNAVIAPLDAAGKVCFVSSVPAHVVSDVSGWFAAGAGITTLTPLRAFDTRNGTGGVAVGKRAAGSVLTVKVTGVNGVPASGVGAVALNVTVTGPDSDGFVTVFPCGEPPTASNLNFSAGQTVPNLVIAPVSPQGTVCFATSATTHLLADVSAWFAAGSDHHALNPVRVFDTRDGLGGVPAQRLRAGEILEFDIAGRFGVPASGAGSVVLNVTAAGALDPGYITVFPCGDRPLSSNLNFSAGQTVPNAVIAPLSTDGSVCFYAPASTHLLVDLSGWFSGASV